MKHNKLNVKRYSEAELKELEAITSLEGAEKRTTIQKLADKTGRTIWGLEAQLRKLKRVPKKRVSKRKKYTKKEVISSPSQVSSNLKEIRFPMESIEVTNKELIIRFFV